LRQELLLLLLLWRLLLPLLLQQLHCRAQLQHW
jgi:hypothetical protein